MDHHDRRHRAILTFLLRGGTLPLFLTATAALCAAHSLIYMHVWHFGGLLLAWLFCMWTAAARIRITAVAASSFALVIAFQGYWALESVRYDWTHPYSGSLAAAKFLKEHPDIANKGLYLTGFSTRGRQILLLRGGTWPNDPQPRTRLLGLVGARTRERSTAVVDYRSIWLSYGWI